jgi:Trypsin-like peptidase domain
MTDDDIEPLLGILRSAIFRIDVRGELSGTGFVVAPGKILTCHHVIASALKSSQGLSSVQVIQPGGWHRPQTPQEDSVWDEELDLAVLHVPSTGDTTPALLGENMITGMSFAVTALPRISRKARP